MEESGGSLDEYLPEPGCEGFDSSMPTVRRLQRKSLMGLFEGMVLHAERKWYRDSVAFLPKRGNGDFLI